MTDDVEPNANIITISIFSRVFSILLYYALQIRLSFRFNLYNFLS